MAFLRAPCFCKHFTSSDQRGHIPNIRLFGLACFGIYGGQDPGFIATSGILFEKISVIFAVHNRLGVHQSHEYQTLDEIYYATNPAGFNQSADVSTYSQKISVRITRATTGDRMQSEHFRSQSGQDKYIYENLLHKEGGHFLEVGAFDGVYLSNTYFFEKQLGWTGILIEMKPDLFAGIADRRSGSKCYNCALGLENMDMLYFDAGDRSGLLRYYEPEGIEYLERHYQPQQTKPAFQLRWINVRPIMDIIAEAGFRELDYFSLDVEGAEMQILSMIELSRISIKVFTVEDNWGMWKKPREFLRPFGYQFIGRLHGDGFFVHESHMDALVAQHGKDYLNHLEAGLDQVIE